MCGIGVNMVKKVEETENHGEESMPLGVVVRLKIRGPAVDLIDTLWIACDMGTSSSGWRS
jgi:hypothetical protein